MTLAEDRYLIEQAALRYARAFDTGDVDTFVGLFAPDGVFEVFVGDGTEPVATISGAAALRQFAEAGVPGGGIAVHHVSGLLFDALDGSSARTTSTLMISKQLDAGPALVTHGAYDDLWARDAGGWLIRQRTYRAAGYL